jgi:hypothetical protein
VSQRECAQVSPPLLVVLLLEAQSFGHVSASPGEHTPSPHTGPPDEDDADECPVVVPDELACDDEERDVVVVVVVVKPPPAPPPAPAVKRSSTDNPHAAMAALPTTSAIVETSFGLPRLVGAEFMRMLPNRRLS